MTGPAPSSRSYWCQACMGWHPVGDHRTGDPVGALLSELTALVGPVRLDVRPDGTATVYRGDNWHHYIASRETVSRTLQDAIDAAKASLERAAALRRVRVIDPDQPFTRDGRPNAVVRERQ